MLTIKRGSLVAVIYDKTLKLNTNDYTENAALTLMSTDVERIAVSLQNIWASVVDVSIAIYLLQKQIGVACITPVLLAARK